MLFNSLEFLVFFPLVFLLYWFVLQKSLRVQNGLLLAASYLFYGWWDWRFLSLIIISSFVDYYVGLKLEKQINTKVRKRLLLFSLLINLGFLGVFKYFNFFVGSFMDFLALFGFSANAATLNIILPVGISFYTFQTLSYTIDIYKGNMKPTKDILGFFTFVAFFPQLVAGPIERAKHLLPQFEVKRVFSYHVAKTGARLILIGFFKKMVIADSLAILVDAVYQSPETYPGLPMVVATVFFAFQIYCDFSGYSDIAIGTARLLGFDLMTNFNTPYFSLSLTEFWRRWHISLSTWFRDYVYIPLGGNRVSDVRNKANIFVTFVVSGLWHGANWTFVIWGAIHGIVLVFEKMTASFRYRLKACLWVRPFQLLATFLLVCLSWVFFRSESVGDAFFILNNMFSDIGSWMNIEESALKFRGMGLKLNDLVRNLFFVTFLLLMEVSFNFDMIKSVFRKYRVLRWCVYYFLLISIVFFGTQNLAGNFIYFQF